MRARFAAWIGLTAVTFASAAFTSSGDGANSPSATRSAVRIDFERDVRPILMDKCFACHGPDSAKRKGDLYLDSRENAFRACDDGRFVVKPFDLEKSDLFHRITTEVADDHMPPAKSGKTLSNEEVDTLRSWIEQGAEWKDHWAFTPPSKNALPDVADASWCANEIDRFVLARLERENLRPSPQAPKEALIRRATFDLTGLPPTIAEIDAFEADSSPNAFEKVVDRLLASPAYGERMASLWLDLAAYADTNGYHIDNNRDMWKWREWVIGAFNANERFDAFTIEQLAGDMLPNATLEQKVASGFNRNHPVTFEGGADPDEYQTKYVIDRVKTTAATWMGLTVGCAECHNHKYDPISQKEFYSFYALFNNIPEKGLDGNKTNPVPSIKVPTDEQNAKLAELDAKSSALQAKFDGPIDEIDRAQQAWEQSIVGDLPPPAEWRALDAASVESKNGATLAKLEDHSILASGVNPAKDVYEFVATPGECTIAAIQLEALLDASLPNGAAGRSDNGNFVLTGVEGETFGASKPDATTKREFGAAEADYSQPDGPFDIANAIDADPATGWAGAQHLRKENRSAVFVLAKPIELGSDGVLRLRLRFESVFAQHSIGRFRISTIADPNQYADLLPPRLGAWTFVGPFKAASGSEADTTVYAPEKEHVDGAPYSEKYDDGALAWQPLADFADGKVQTLPGGDNSAWFLARTIETQKARKLVLHLGSDDTLRLWINGKQVFSHLEPRSPAPDQDRVEVELAAGVNRLLAKVVNYSGGTGFYFRAEALGRDGLTPELVGVVRAKDDARSDAQKKSLREFYRTKVSDAGKALAAELDAAKKERAMLFDSIPESMVMEEQAMRRDTFVLMRGDYRSHGDKVEPGVPSCLPQPESGAVTNRLELARWLVSGKHPLVGRVTVNRFWQMLFGIGLVKTSEDFGVRAELPSHPELLDWLAVDFVERGWDVKALLKSIVMSSTYRQSARFEPELVERDPDNRLLARGPRVRLTAEMIRDDALAVSGLLVEKIGGPSVRPYQPPGLWEAVSFSADFSSQSYVQDHGADLWRRGLYVYWKRSLPYPSLATFDAPIRETCTSKRPETNTPLQALVLLNDPVYVEAARALGARIEREGGTSDETRLRFAFRLCTSREPKENELAVLKRVVDVERANFANDADSAAKLVHVGESPAADDLDPKELAAWSALANVLLNLDETLHRG